MHVDSTYLTQVQRSFRWSLLFNCFILC